LIIYLIYRIKQEQTPHKTEIAKLSSLLKNHLQITIKESDNCFIISSSFMKKFYITTAIAYPNARPHMGHALEIIQADALARFYRIL
jgi:leucyl-tRNA synthetase